MASVPKSDPSKTAVTTEQYLDWLFSPALEACPEGLVTPAVLPAKLDGETPPVAAQFRDPRDAAEWCLNRATHNNVYCHSALHKAGVTSKGSIETAMASSALFADLDAASPHRDANHPEKREKNNAMRAPDVASLLKLGREFERFYHVKLAFVFSGYGIYPVLPFREPWVFDSDEERREANALQKRFALAFRQLAEPHGWAASVESCDLAKILRVPGTKNHKSNPPLDVYVEIPEGFPGIDPVELDELLPRLPEEAKTLAGAPPFVINRAAQPPVAKFQALYANSSKFQRSWDHDRPDLKDDSFSGYELSLASIAAIAGWEPQEIIDLLVAFRLKYGSKPKQAISYAHTLRKALGLAEDVNSRRESIGFDVTDLLAACSPLDALNAALIFRRGNKRLRIKNVMQRGRRYFLIDEHDRECDVGTLEEGFKFSHSRARVLEAFHFLLDAPHNKQGAMWNPVMELIRELGAMNYEDIEDTTPDQTRSWLAKALRSIPPAYCRAMTSAEVYLANRSVESVTRGAFVHALYMPGNNSTAQPPRFICWRPGRRLWIHVPTFVYWASTSGGLDKRSLDDDEMNQRLRDLDFQIGKQKTGRDPESRKTNQQRWAISPPNFEVEKGLTAQPGWPEDTPESVDED